MSGMSNNSVISCLYPNKCAVCDEIIREGNVFCEYCGRVINNIDYRNWCVKCGLPKDVCRCKIREFRFSGIVAAYINNGAAQKAYYSYKIGRREELASFFAKKAANAVKTVFGDLHFDAVISVPNSKSGLLRRGFDHGGKIAAGLSDILGLPYLRGVLKVKPFKSKQHKSSFADRLENVRGKYYTVKRLNIKRVLLFDDIYTTCATLDECAKELMFAGVGEVYCAAVLSTSRKKKQTGVNNGN